MGISRDKLHKRRATGGRRKIIRLKRKFELGRAPASTKLGDKRIHLIRTRGGHYKHRALRLNEGHFVWPGEAATKRTRILNVVYNATSNELVRTNTLVKGAIVLIDATPFRQWYDQFYNVQIGKAKADEEKKDVALEAAGEKKEGEPAKKDVAKDKKKATKDDKKAPAKAKPEEIKKDSSKAKKDDKKEEGAAGKAKKQSDHLHRKINKRNKSRVLEQALKEQFNTGRLYAKISSRPGQSGRADGYILEGEELAFYLRKIIKKKKT